MGHPLAILVVLSATGMPVAPEPATVQPFACPPAAFGDAALIVAAAPVRRRDDVVAVGDAIPLANGDGRLALRGTWGGTQSGGPPDARIAGLGARWAAARIGPPGTGLPGTGTTGAYRLMRWVVVRQIPLRPHWI